MSQNLVHNLTLKDMLIKAVLAFETDNSLSAASLWDAWDLSAPRIRLTLYNSMPIEKVQLLIFLGFATFGFDILVISCLILTNETSNKIAMFNKHICISEFYDYTNAVITSTAWVSLVLPVDVAIVVDVVVARCVVDIVVKRVVVGFFVVVWPVPKYR